MNGCHNLLREQQYSNDGRDVVLILGVLGDQFDFRDLDKRAILNAEPCGFEHLVGETFLCSHDLLDHLVPCLTDGFKLLRYECGGWGCRSSDRRFVSLLLLDDVELITYITDLLLRLFSVMYGFIDFLLDTEQFRVASQQTIQFGMLVPLHQLRQSGEYLSPWTTWKLGLSYECLCIYTLILSEVNCSTDRHSFSTFFIILTLHFQNFILFLRLWLMTY